MKLNKAPCGVTHTVPIAKGNITSTEGGDSVKGGILKGTKYAWLCQGPFLKIIDVSNGEKIAGWRFGAACSEFVTEVSCAVELPYSDDASNLKQIVLGLECEVIGGMICIFDVQGSRLLRAIRIPGKPLSLSIVDSGSSGCEGQYPLPGLLSSMSGIIAVGLQGGSVFLIDLCHLSCEELLNTWFNDDREEVHDELNPCQLLPINKDDDDSDKLEKKCAAAAVSGDHLCLLLNEAAFVQDNFLLLEPGGEVCACFKTQNIGVTSLLYVPRIASLIVGYSFGCFQLWNLMHLTLNYTSRTMKDPLPVMHLGFQEPSDDPCNFCYLWAVHSSTDEFPSSSPPVGIMYALSYDSKEWVDGYGYLYQDYQSCHFRFEYNLEVDSSEEVDSISCVSFNTLSNVASQRNMPEDGCDEVTSENDFSLCIFVWETYDSGNKPISTYLSLFDLNQWYKDQMPVRVTDVEDENLGYLVTFSLNCIRQKEEASQIETPLLDIRVDPQNLSQFKSFQPQEEHFHPSALSFVSHCLLEDKIVSLSHPGLQRYLLLYMEKEGPICLLRPLNLFKHTVMVGLKPVLVDMNGSSDVPAVAQREFLLSVALENQMLGFLHRCASDWANGSVSGVDCSLPMLLSWGYQRAMVLQETADGLCVHLFDHTGIRLDKNECRLLDNCASQLRQLATLFEGILNDCRLLNLLNLEDFRQKTNNLNLIALYLEVLLWFLNVGLLPEFPEDEFDNDASDDKIPYPSSVLTKFYSDRRIEFKNLNLKNGTKASLYIDQLLQNENNGSELANLWISDGGSGMYPPPSIQSLLAMYLQDGIDIQTKNSIVIYVFLDLATLLDPERYSRTIEYFVKFPCAFYMTPSIIKVTQAFWLLDQKHFEDALDMVLDPLVSPKDLQPWQHRFIVHALLSQGQHTKALEYFTVRQLPIQGIEDIQLKITLLVMNKQVTQAYNFLQQYHNEENNKELLLHFYQECGKAQQLGTVLKLMLSPAEEDLLMNYLQSCNISQSEDMQVVFYLMRSRVIEAVAVNERINFSGNRKVASRRTRNESTVRDMLVGGYAKTLPSVTRQLANYCSQQKKLLSNWRQVQRPTPMSVDVNYGTKQAVSYKSSLIHATLEKARETWMMPVHSPFSSEARKEIMDVSAMQNLPFLCTSHDSFRHDRETTPVVFPSVTSSIKRRLDDDGGVHMSTPLKRSRLENSSPVDNYLLLTNKNINERDHSAINSPLLKTPLVKRVTPMKQSSARSTQDKSGSKPFAESFTPQSILKVRNLVRCSVSPEHSQGREDDLLSREQTKVKHNEERFFSRQIRFSLPVPNEIQEQPLSSSTPEISEKKVNPPKRVVDATTRLPLRSSLSLLQKPVVETSDEVSKKKSWEQRTPAKEMISEKDTFVFGAANSSTAVNAKSDPVFLFGSGYSSAAVNAKSDAEIIQTEDNVCKLNESVGDESFYSATNSSDSGASKDNSKFDIDNGESSPSYNHGKYIHEMKEIKPRKRLSRVKFSLQCNLSDNGKQKEVEEDSAQDAEEAPKFESIVAHKDTITESEVKHLSSEIDDDSSESDDSEDNSNIESISSKKSILGDTCINISSSSSTNEESSVSYNTEESDDSLINSAPEIKAEMSQRSDVSSVGKIQQVKARRPLSRVRKSVILDNSNSFLLQMKTSRFLETAYDMKKDVLTDDTKIEIGVEAEEKKEDEDDSINISDDESLGADSVVADDTDVEIVEEHKAKLSFSYTSTESKELEISGSMGIQSHVAWKQNTTQGDMHVSFGDISRNTVQESYYQENHGGVDVSSVFQNDSTVLKSVRCGEFVETDQAELFSECGKTYASLTTVSTEQSSYQPMLPLHPDVNQGISVLDNYSEGQGNLSSLISVEHPPYLSGLTYSSTVGNDHESSETFVGTENACTVADQGVLLTKGSENRHAAESSANMMEQDSSSTAGGTSGTIELASDENEETNLPRTVSNQDNLQHSTMNYESALKGSYDVLEDTSHPTINSRYSCGESAEMDVVSDSECNKEPVDKVQYKNEVKHETYMRSQSYREEKCENQRPSNGNSSYSKNLNWNKDPDEEDLVLKLSDSENDENNSGREGVEDQPQTTEGFKRIIPQVNVDFENQLEKAVTSDHTTQKTETPMSLEHHVEYGSTPIDEKFEDHTRSNIPFTSHSMCTEIVTPTELMQTVGQNHSHPLVDNSLNRDCVENQQLQHIVQEKENTPKLVARAEQDLPCLSNQSSSSMDGVSQIPNVTVSENHEIKQSNSEIFEDHYSLRSKQRSRPSSVQSEPPQMCDVLETEHHSKEISQKHSGNIRVRTRRSSLQIEPLESEDVESENKNESVIEEPVSLTRSKPTPRRRSSSVQSEPPQMCDALETEHQSKEISQKRSGNIRVRTRRSSLQIEPLKSEDVESENKNETVIEEPVSLTMSKPTPRRRSSSVQSEPPRVANVLNAEHQNKEISQKPSDHIRPRTRRSSLQVEYSGTSDESAIPRKNETMLFEEISTPNTRQRRLFGSIQSEPPQMADVAEIEHQIKDQNNGTTQECSEIIVRPRSLLQTGTPQTDSDSSTECKEGAGIMDDGNASKTRTRRLLSSIQSEAPRMNEVSDIESQVEDKNVSSLEHPEVIISHRTRRSSPLPTGNESAAKSEEMTEAVDETSTPRSRRRSSSVQSEPCQMLDVSLDEGKAVSQNALKESGMLNKQRRRRNSLQNEYSEMASASASENKGFEISEERFTPMTRQKSHSTSMHVGHSGIEMSLEKEEQTEKYKNEKSFHKERKSLHASSSANTSIQENVSGIPLVPDEPQPSTSSVSQEEENKMNLRSRRAYSVDRELPNIRGKKKYVNSENFSDSDDCSVQSEPPQLCDVSESRQLRSTKSRKGLLKKRSRKSSYVLKIAAPKLACVKEEPEIESYVGEEQVTSQTAKSENASVRNLRQRKRSESGDSQTSSLGKGRVLRNCHSDDKADSPVSISSRSTVILDQSQKRKRSSSPSSPERLEVKKFQKFNEDTAFGNVAPEAAKETTEEGKGSKANPHEIEQYATARRLTRYQKNLLERSMESTKGVHREFHGRHLPSDRSGEESDGESVASGYTSGSSHVRSSARLQEKRQLIIDRSPSQSSRASTSEHSPLKLASRHLFSPAHSSDKPGGSSPVSVHSGKSTSSVSSSQWPSPDSAQLQSPLKPRRKSFQNAQHALLSPSVKKHSSLKTPVTTTDTSEAESVDETDERIFDLKQTKKDVETASETGSVKSHASTASSVGRSTRSTSKHETKQSSKTRKPKGGSARQSLVQPLRLFKEGSSIVSSSSEDSPTKDTKSKEEAIMSAKTDTQQQKAVEKPEHRKPLSLYKKRKYIRLYSLQKKT